MKIFKKLSNNIPIIFVTLMSIFQIYRNNKYQEIIDLFKNIKWLINFIIILLFLVYVRLSKNSKLISASKKAILGFIIAIFAYIDLTLAPFWIIFVLAYFGDGFI